MENRKGAKEKARIGAVANLLSVVIALLVLFYLLNKKIEISPEWKDGQTIEIVEIKNSRDNNRVNLFDGKLVAYPGQKIILRIKVEKNKDGEVNLRPEWKITN